MKIDKAQAFVGAGSNLGDRESYLSQALKKVEIIENLEVTGVSSIYETAPWGKAEQGWFLNAVWRLETSLSPFQLLHRLLSIEKELGRVRNERWGPRTIDLDLLIYGEEVIATRELVVPHPRLKERAFVVVPLAELAPNLVIPGVGKIEEILHQVKFSDNQILPWQKHGVKMN